MGVLGLPVGRSGRPRARSGRRGVLETVFNVKLFHLVVFFRPVTMARWPPRSGCLRVRVFHTTPRWKKFSSEKICGAPSLRYNLSGRSRVGGGVPPSPYLSIFQVYISYYDFWEACASKLYEVVVLCLYTLKNWGASPLNLNLVFFLRAISTFAPVSCPTLQKIKKISLYN